MRRVLAMIASLVNSENGYLLVDEIDTGLHHTVLNDIWRVIFETAQRLNIQVFATTHSWDCVKAFGSVLQEQTAPKGKLFRLERMDKNIQAIEYYPSELAVALQQQIEMR